MSISNFDCDRLGIKCFWQFLLVAHRQNLRSLIFTAQSDSENEKEDKRNLRSFSTFEAIITDFEWNNRLCLESNAQGAYQTGNLKPVPKYKAM